MSGRLATAPDEVMHRLLIDPAIKRDLQSNFHYFLEVNAAHVLMLADCRIIDHRTAAQLLTANGEISNAGPENLPSSPDAEDLYFTIEADLMRRVGHDVGGALHTARSRNDILASVARMRTREELFTTIEQIHQFRTSLLELAQEHATDVISGYTHLQAAEPITLGHYFAAAAFAVARDCNRLMSSYATVNESPLGACAMAGTTFDIDRQETAALLGFDRPMANSIDSVASRDYIIEITSDLAILTNNLSRFATDLQMWASGEFGYLEIDSSVAVTSSIMPQKKNPVTLEHVKAKASHLEAAFVSATTALKSAPYSHSREPSVESIKYIWEAFHDTQNSIELLDHTLSKSTFNIDLMRERTKSNFSTVTELANTLVRQAGIPFREAHTIVGRLVTECIERGEDATHITSRQLDEVAHEVSRRRPTLPEKQVAEALNPSDNVKRRTAFGSPAPDEVRTRVAEAKQQLADNIAELSELTVRRKEAKEELKHRTMAVANGG